MIKPKEFKQERLTGIFSQRKIGMEKVYVTKTGNCFHQITCHHVKEERREIGLFEIKYHSLRPCKICNPVI